VSIAKPFVNRVTRRLVAFPIALGCGAAGAAPAGAEPNPFGTLSCSCEQAASVGGVDPVEEIRRGIREGLSAWLPGLPPPTHTPSMGGG
jgi:hypothetical protein